jgi:hypothetical protein
MPAWLKVAGLQRNTPWQSAHWLDVGRWLADFPSASVPLWQLAQLPRASAWSKRASRQATVVWQSSQSLELGTWFAGRRVRAEEPLPR